MNAYEIEEALDIRENRAVEKVDCQVVYAREDDGSWSVEGLDHKSIPTFQSLPADTPETDVRAIALRNLRLQLLAEVRQIELELDELC